MATWLFCGPSLTALPLRKSQNEEGKQVASYSETQGMAGVWKTVVISVSPPKVMPANNLSLVFSTRRYYSVVPLGFCPLTLFSLRALRFGDQELEKSYELGSFLKFCFLKSGCSPPFFFLRLIDWFLATQVLSGCEKVVSSYGEQGLLSSCSALAPHCSGLSSYPVGAPERLGRLSSCGTWA